MGNETTTTTQNLEYLNYIYMMSMNRMNQGTLYQICLIMSSKNTNYTKRLAYGYKNSPTLESYIEKQLNKLNNNPIIVSKDERVKK